MVASEEKIRPERTKNYDISQIINSMKELQRARHAEREKELAQRKQDLDLKFQQFLDNQRKNREFLAVYKQKSPQKESQDPLDIE